MTQYTKEIVAQMEAKGSFTYAEAVAFAEAHGLKPRSVIAKIKSMKLAYECKPARVTKQGEPVVLKATFVATIEAAVGVALPSLTKASKEDLQKLAEVLSA